MFISSTTFTNFPVMSLRSSDQVAIVSQVIINPFDLKVQAFKLSGRRLENPKDSYLLVNDIREVSHIGFIINDSEDIVASADVIKLRKTIELNFKLIDLPVFDKKNRKIGKVIDYIINGNDLSVHQLVVKRPMLKDFLDPELTIHRSQIAEVSQKKIVIKNEFNELRDIERQMAMNNFVNPFRKDRPAEQK